MKRIVQIGLIALVVIGGITVANRRKALQLQEQERLARVQVVRQKILEKGVPSVFQKGASQTEGWLSVVGWDAVKKGLELSDEQLAELKKITYETIIPREKEHADDYFAFYHAQLREFWVFYEFQKQLYEKMHGTQLNDFYFLRNLNLFVQTEETAQEWLSKQSKIFDDEEYFRHQLLATNVAFPGNIRPGESSADFYLSCRSVSPPALEEVTHSVLASFFDVNSDIEKAALVDAISSMMELVEKIKEENKCGLLLSIFIPKYLVDSCAYMSGGFGTPADDHLDSKELSQVLTALMNNPKSINYIELMQARLRLVEAAFADPKSGIKIFMTHRMSDQRVKSYKQKIAQMVQSLIESQAQRKYWKFVVDWTHSFDTILRGNFWRMSEKLRKYKEYESLVRLRELEFIHSALNQQKEIDTKKALLLVEKGVIDNKDLVRQGAWDLIKRLAENDRIDAPQAMQFIEKGIADKDEIVRRIAREIKDNYLSDKK